MVIQLGVFEGVRGGLCGGALLSPRKELCVGSSHRSAFTSALGALPLVPNCEGPSLLLGTPEWWNEAIPACV